MKKIILLSSVFGLLSVSGYCQSDNKDDKKKKKEKAEQVNTPSKRICIYTSLPVLPQTVVAKDISLDDLQPEIDPIYRCGNVEEYNTNIKLQENTNE